ncbi:formate dehydrogenase alpha subunit [Desulfacinum hydrothermale DSM 13146]|uniref:Formate dehydrogenase alpha subunit n=1 Tax=Desulfacinum hydrothermale DSM 13146 TaxID=1121390 RepID=A0A1W1X719_9BACT|nr:molybdopterin-dependent oxidoreductase [Desulfacinum hydrothermale]SMC19745.1 formate dehydrogenase alpha subunit [Desulfacinum hydrothermale DSM 13146]
MSDVNIWINDQQVKAKAGQTILEAADAAGVYIPRLCFHPALEPSGSCRLCAVEIDGQRGLPAACSTPVSEGLRVNTQSAKVLDFRREMLQLILRDHPRQCLGCPRNGTCELQQLVTVVGIDFPYPPPDKERPEPLPGGAYFERDYSLCVRCGRCVRVCHEVRGARAIVFRQSKDGRPEVGTPFDRPLEEAGCQFCGACVDACPVGALRENLSDVHGEPTEKMQAMCQALTAIVTDLYKKELETQWGTALCPICSAGCRLMVEKAADETIVQVKPSPDGPSNQGQACVQGRFLLKRHLRRPDRLESPMILENGQYRPASWDEALDRLAGALADVPADRVAFLTDGRLTNEELFRLGRLAQGALPGAQLGVAVPAGQVLFEKVLEEELGTAAATNSLEDLGGSPAIFALGLNPAASQPIAGTRIRQAVLKGAKLVVANPYDVSIARYAHVHLRPVPGSETALVLGLLRVILDEGGADQELPTDQQQAFKEMTAAYDLETVSRLTGIPDETLVEAGCLLAAQPTVAVLAGLGALSAPDVTDLARALLSLARAKGSLGRPGGGFWPLWGAGNLQGARDLGWSPQVMDALAQGKIQAAVVAAESHDGTLWDVLAPYASKLEFLAVHDTAPPPQSIQAQVLLPMASILEKEGSLTNGERRVQWTERTLEGPDQARSALFVAQALAARRNLDLPEATPGDILDELAQAVSGYGGIHRSRARFQPVQVPCPARDHEGTPVLFQDAVPTWKPWTPAAPPAPPEEDAAAEFPYAVAAKESLLPSYVGSLLAPEAQAVLACDGEIEMNPADAYRLECDAGDTVAVLFNGGEVTGRLALNIHLPPRLVAVKAEALQAAGASNRSGASIAAKVEKR